MPVLANPLSVTECEKIICRPGGPFELEDVVLDGHKVRAWKDQPPTLRALVMDRMTRNASNAFLSSPIADPEPFHARESLTHGEAFERALQLAGLLREQGIGLGTRVAIGGGNCTGWVVSFIAVVLLGGVPVLLNNALHADASVHCLKLTQPALVLVDDGMADQLGPLAATLKDNGVGPMWCWTSLAHLKPQVAKAMIELTSLKAKGSSVDAVRAGEGLSALNPESDGVIYFTSGTTSMPKGVLVTQRQALHIIRSPGYVLARSLVRMGTPVEDAIAFAAAPKPEGVALLSIPLFHVQGNLNWLVCAIHDGSKLVFLRRWSVPDAVKLMVSEKVAKIGGVPAIATSVLQSPLLPKDFVLAQTTFGGASPPSRLPSDLVKRWPEHIVATGWGMTETNSSHTGFIGIEYINKPLSCGSRLPISDVRIVDPATRKQLPANQAGVLLVRGANIMKCYVNNPEATAKTIDADGWLDTGDVAMVDEDEDLYITDRAKDIIIRGGENIPSAEVERAIAQDDRVGEACAVPVPDDILGERVGVAVSLAPGATATPESIAEAVSPRLRYPARPAIVVVVPGSLPWNASQKILKSEVKKIVVDAWEKRGRKPMSDSRARL